MTTAIRELSPQSVWNYFSDLNAVPRPSKQEERVIEFMMDFGKSLGLETHRDTVGNVLIKKPATPGKENSPVVCLQSHLDMVHQKNAGTDFDFSRQGIKMLLDGDWVKADGTTLGADNGIGVAYAMAVLASDDLAHPPLEALFTIDEETGMTGAKNLKGGLMKAKFLLNLDTEDDTELCIGCAGGVDVTGNGRYEQEAVPENWSVFQVGVSGLTGGHSGMEIHLGRGNANKLMNRILRALGPVRLVEIDGGGLRNAIPRESTARFAAEASREVELREAFAKAVADLKTEYATTDGALECKLEKMDSAHGRAATLEATARVIRCIYSLPNGIYRLSPDVEGLVQTSSNLARVVLRNGELTINCLVRGSVSSEKHDMAQAIACALEQIGLNCEFRGDYPGWVPKPESEVVRLMSEIYRELFQETAHVMACHAGLECGILGTNYPDMEMISFGPNIKGAHSPDERVQVSSVEKSWRLLIETLARL